LILLPLLVLLTGQTPRGGGFLWDFALMLGYACLAMMGVQFWLTARFKRASAPFGIDILYYFHRYLASIAYLLLLAHAGLLYAAFPAVVGALDPRSAAWSMTVGWMALLTFTALMVCSLWRKSLRIEYDRWRRWHTGLAVLGMVLAVGHVLGSASYLDPPWKRVLWTLMALSWLGLWIWVRLLRPWRLTRHPYRVTAVQREAGRTWTLTLEPEQPPVFAYRAGQFAWLSLRASPFALREHPFSFASSPTRKGSLAFTIKELGDFTSTIGTVQPGERAYVDGPYGHFGIDRYPDAGGFVFVAGGVGLAPIVSMLRALADNHERRPLWLFYGNRRADRIALREQLDQLAGHLDLRIVHVLSEPPGDWQGERGFISYEVMRRHLPEDLDGLHFFVCGPDPMIRLVESNLERFGVPLRRMHSEIFDLA
jgi:predicted ferric reductase